MRKELVACGGTPYVADELEDERGWFLWAMEPGSNVYHVGPHGCTCESYRKRTTCKHVAAVDAMPVPKALQLERRDRRHSRG